MSNTIELDIPVLSSTEIDSLNVIRAENAAKAEMAEKSAAPVSAKINLLDLNRKQMREFFIKMGEKPFRADQVMKWMYHYCSDDFEDMTDINKTLRNKLASVAEIRAPEVAVEQRSADGTIKWAIQVGNQQVETVYIPDGDRATLCVSSQVGCALECTFCSTAQQGFNRTLRVSGLARRENYRCGKNCRHTSYYQRGDDGHGRAFAQPE